MWTFVAAEEKPALRYFLISLNCEKMGRRITPEHEEQLKRIQGKRDSDSVSLKDFYWVQG